MNPRVWYITFDLGDEKSAQVRIPPELSKSGREEIKIVSGRGEAQSIAMRINSHLKRTGQLPEDLLEGFNVVEAIHHQRSALMNMQVNSDTSLEQITGPIEPCPLANSDFWRAVAELDQAIALFNTRVDQCCQAIQEFKANL